jgi:hypothetical protein
MLFQETGQRYSDAFLVIDEKNARALRDAAGADGVLGSDAFEFAQKKLPAATKGLDWLLGDCLKKSPWSNTRAAQAVQYRTCRRGCVVVVEFSSAASFPRNEDLSWTPRCNEIFRSRRTTERKERAAAT